MEAPLGGLRVFCQTKGHTKRPYFKSRKPENSSPVEDSYSYHNILGVVKIELQHVVGIHVEGAPRFGG